MPRRENTFRVDYSQFPKLLSHEEVHKFISKELGLSRENVSLLQPSRRLGCTFVKVSSLTLAEKIVEQHDGKHEFVFDGKSYKLRVTMEDGAVEVKLLDLPESVTNEQITVFLADFGEIISVRNLLWDDRYTEFGGVNTGVRIVRMVVTKNIPSLVTIQGEETAVGYKGQRQTCLHCHEFAHIGIPCVQNKKLLVQKLAADQSYANVTKGKPSNRPQPIKTSDPRKPPSVSSARTESVLSEQQASSGVKPNFLGDKESRAAATQQQNTMPPPAVPVATIPSATQTVNHLSPASIPTSASSRRNDGHETDSSQASMASNRSRRSNRKPPGKKMKHSAEDATTTIEHGRGSDEEMQQ